MPAQSSAARTKAFARDGATQRPKGLEEHADAGERPPQLSLLVGGEGVRAG